MSVSMEVATSMLIVAFCILSASSEADGLKCWQCFGKSHEECLETGKLVSCPSDQDACATVVRRNLLRRTIWKHCKQKLACWNDREQNWDRYGGRNQCSDKRFSSVCSCCCDKDSCNTEERCQAFDESRDCPPQPRRLYKGSVSCTNANRLGSQCEFRCTSPGYDVSPSWAKKTQCMGNRQWSSPTPCCAKPCPPYAPFDFVGLANRKQDKKFAKIMASFGQGFVELIGKVDPQHYREARIMFSDVVHPEISRFFNATQDEFIQENGLIRNPAAGAGDVYTGGPVNTGNALRYVRDHVIAKGHRDEFHRDVVVAFLDKNSDDEVLDAARALRGDGVLTYAVFMKFKDYGDINMQQLLDIAGEPGHVFVVEGDFETAGRQMAKELIGHVCQDVCGP